MIKRISVLAVSVGLVSTLLGSAAQATEADSVQIRRESSITWADASVAGDASVRVVFLSPKNSNGRRQVWQSCRFEANASGTYRCGIDTATGSLAAKRQGTWLVKVLVDGTRTAKTRFTL